MGHQAEAADGEIQGVGIRVRVLRREKQAEYFSLYVPLVRTPRLIIYWRIGESCARPRIRPVGPRDGRSVVEGLRPKTEEVRPKRRSHGQNAFLVARVLASRLFQGRALLVGAL